MNKITVHCSGDVQLPFKGLDAVYISNLSEKIMQLLRADEDSISVIVCSNDEIREINKKYRNKDYPTDVISFAYDDEPFPGEDEELSQKGDIFFSVEKAEEQAGEFDVTFLNEIKRLIVHAVLHLYGYDHELGEKQALAMYQREDEILGKL